MFYKIETENGEISIGKSVIGKIITTIVDDFQGRVFLTNKSGKMPGLVAKIGGMDDMNVMDIHLSETGIEIKFYIAIRFGTSIRMATEKLISEIKETVEGMMGLHVNSVAIIVTGTVSRNTAKRNIEIKG